MSRYHEGMIVRTSYGTGPYRVVDIIRDCQCPSFTDAVSLLAEAPPSSPHVHLICRKVGERTGFYYLNGYDENLRSVWSDDYLIVEGEANALLTLICLL